MDLDAELDDLVAEISGGGSSNPFAAKSSGGGASVESEVDDLLAELDLPTEKPATIDDFDALMAGFEDSGVTARVVSAKKPQIKRKGKYTVTGAMADQELFTTLDDLETKIKTTNLTAGAKGASEKTAELFAASSLGSELDPTFFRILRLLFLGSLCKLIAQPELSFSKVEFSSISLHL